MRKIVPQIEYDNCIIFDIVRGDNFSQMDDIYKIAASINPSGYRFEQIKIPYFRRFSFRHELCFKIRQIMNLSYLKTYIFTHVLLVQTGFSHAEYHTTSYLKMATRLEF